jgi:PIN domain nuclease of toxin-antitoxin system
METVVHSFQWTRDPFDRLITAQAASYNQVLLTKDETIRKHYANAIW